jgi:hypothetical protein
MITISDRGTDEAIAFCRRGMVDPEKCRYPSQARRNAFSAGSKEKAYQEFTAALTQKSR